MIHQANVAGCCQRPAPLPLSTNVVGTKRYCKEPRRYIVTRGPTMTTTMMLVVGLLVLPLLLLSRPAAGTKISRYRKQRKAVGLDGKITPPPSDDHGRRQQHFFLRGVNERKKKQTVWRTLRTKQQISRSKTINNENICLPLPAGSSTT